MVSIQSSFHITFLVTFIHGSIWESQLLAIPPAVLTFCEWHISQLFLFRRRTDFWSRICRCGVGYPNEHAVHVALKKARSWLDKLATQNNVSEMS